MTRSLRIWTMIHKADKCLLNAQQDRRIDKWKYETNLMFSYVALRSRAASVLIKLKTDKQRRAA